MSKRRRKHAHPEQRADPTGPFRRHAVWLYSGVFLFHSLIIYGVWPKLAMPSLIAVLASALFGLSMRWVRSATAVLGAAIFLLSFLALYLMGVAAPIALLVLSERREWIPWSVLLIASTLLWLVGWRMRASFRSEWSAPLEETPGVVLDRENQTVVRYPTEGHSGFATCAAVLILVLLVVLMVVFSDASGYHVIAFGIGPLGVAVLGAEYVARGATYYWTLRHWQAKHGVRLKLPSLR